MRIQTIGAVAAFLASTALAFASGPATKDAAVAMVKNAVAPKGGRDDKGL